MRGTTANTRLGEILRSLLESGFEAVRLKTRPFRDEPEPKHEWVPHWIEQYGLSKDLGAYGIYAVCRKTGAIRERYPAWLYS